MKPKSVLEETDADTKVSGLGLRRVSINDVVKERKNVNEYGNKDFFSNVLFI